ncbi:transposase [Nocardia nova]|uniref:Transposase n=1 Tax=Nocardia nova TaxID=37330 RepID=A0A2S6ARI2_9NOCA|nr:transposase [Nocardia nova]PPJ37852.1 transposase [Nocardia nova]
MAAAEIHGEKPLDAAERAELQRLRRQVAEQDKDIAFLKKASAYFAAMQTNRPGSI